MNSKIVPAKYYFKTGLIPFVKLLIKEQDQLGAKNNGVLKVVKAFVEELPNP